MVHMSIDNDEQYEGMCEKCKEDMNIKSCNTCGKKIEEKQDSINPNFDENMFEKLKKQAE